MAQGINPLAVSGVAAAGVAVGGAGAGGIAGGGDGEECAGSMLCVAASGQCCFLRMSPRGPPECPSSC